MIPILLFVISFATGPAIFWVLARQQPSPGYFAGLWIAAVLLAGGAFLVPSLLGVTQTTGTALIVMLWLGWIMVITLCFIAVRARVEDRRTLRWAFALGAMATTLPWFGLYTAQMIGT